ncbi:MAG: GNAT family N-acetyltransferase [Crocinitomicaceae bacterium]|nr:GNAT family N-acetyltransferase [Crocinitomicaceae bacterium]
MIRKLTEKDAQNLDLIGVLVFNINKNYSETEKEFWGDAVERTSPTAFQKEIIQNNVLAYFEKEQVLGSVAYEIKGTEAKFGMLSVNLQDHGKRIGSQLCRAMEDDLMSQGVSKLHLELLVPRNYESENKNNIRDWYERNGFESVDRIQAEDFPNLPFQQLLIESDFIKMTKNL